METPSVPRLGAVLPALVRDQATRGRGGGATKRCFLPSRGTPAAPHPPPRAFIELSICESPKPVQISAFYLKPASHPGRLFGKRRRGSTLFTGGHRQRSGSHAPIGSPTLRPLRSVLTLLYLPRPQVLTHSPPATHTSNPTGCQVPKGTHSCLHLHKHTPRTHPHGAPSHSHICTSCTHTGTHASTH